MLQSIFLTSNAKITLFLKKRPTEKNDKKIYQIQLIIRRARFFLFSKNAASTKTEYNFFGHLLVITGKHFLKKKMIIPWRTIEWGSAPKSNFYVTHLRASSSVSLFFGRMNITKTANNSYPLKNSKILYRKKRKENPYLYVFFFTRLRYKNWKKFLLSVTFLTSSVTNIIIFFLLRTRGDFFTVICCMLPRRLYNTQGNINIISVKLLLIHIKSLLLCYNFEMITYWR